MACFCVDAVAFAFLLTEKCSERVSAGIEQECAREGVKRRDRPPMRANAEDQSKKRTLIAQKVQVITLYLKFIRLGGR